MCADDQLRAAIRLMSEMRRRSERKTGDPISSPDRSLFAEMKQRDVLTKREMTDAEFASIISRSGKTQARPIRAVG